MRPLFAATFLGATAIVASACSFLVSTNGLVGASDADGGDAGADAFVGGDGSVASDASGDVAALPDVQIVDSAAGPCACLPTPAGWTGPLAVWTGATAPPSCPTDYPSPRLDALADLDFGPATCDCSCGPPTPDGPCPSSFPVQIYGTNQCGATACDTVTVTGSCAGVQSNCTFANGMQAKPTPPTASCTPSADVRVVPAEWKSKTRTCEIERPPEQGACAADEKCVPLPHAPMEPRPCITMAGDVACPPGSYAVRRVFYTSANDTRGCTACTCGAASTSCSGSITECSGSSSPIALPTDCSKLNDPSGIKLTGPLVLDAGTCTPSAVQPTGDVAPQGATTVCCAP